MFDDAIGSHAYRLCQTSVLVVQPLASQVPPFLILLSFYIVAILQAAREFAAVKATLDMLSARDPARPSLELTLDTLRLQTDDDRAATVGHANSPMIQMPPPPLLSMLRPGEMDADASRSTSPSPPRHFTTAL